MDLLPGCAFQAAGCVYKDLCIIRSDTLMVGDQLDFDRLNVKAIFWSEILFKNITKHPNQLLSLISIQLLLMLIFKLLF